MKPNHILASLVVTSAVATAAWAQSPGEPDLSKVKVKLGPLMMTPTIALTNVGIDQNVFNDPPDKDPKSDFTATVTPMTDLWVRMGPSWISANVKEDIIWYQKYSSERAANTSYRVGWRAPLSRLILTSNLGYTTARDRVGPEIDARVPRREFMYNGTVEVRALTRTFFGVTGQRLRTTYDTDSTFAGVNLDNELSRTTESAGVVIRQEITTLTQMTLTAARSRDRFDVDPLRDSTSDLASVSIQFDPVALLKGGATVGYRDFRPSSPDLTESRGTTLAANLSYVLLGATRFAAHATRDIEYSYDVNQPFYRLTGVDGSIAQQIFGPVDVIVRAGAQRLDYTTRAGAIVQVPNRTDDVRTYGGGIGFHLNNDLRLGINIDKEIRTSEVADRRYNNLKIGSALTYGF